MLKACTKPLDKHIICVIIHMNTQTYEWSIAMENHDKTPICCENRTHTDEGARITAMPDDELLYDLAELFKVFGDSTRIKILYALFENEMCVQDIAALLNMNQSAISHQLRVLKQSRLVKNRREGKQVIYSLADDHVYTIIGQGMTHIEE